MFFPLLIHLTGVLSKIVLTPCAILSIVPEAVCCWFHQVSSHLGEEVFFSLLISIQSTVSVVAEFRLYLEKFSISPLQTCVFCCWFSNNSIQSFFEGCFPSSFVAEIVIFFSVPLSQQSSFYSFVPEALWSLLSSSYHLVLPRSCSFLCLSIQPEWCLKSFLPLVPFFQ